MMAYDLQVSGQKDFLGVRVAVKSLVSLFRSSQANTLLITLDQ